MYYDNKLIDTTLFLIYQNKNTDKSYSLGKEIFKGINRRRRKKGYSQSCAF